jgi:hypothetical protein
MGKFSDMNKKQRKAASELGDAQRKVDRAREAFEKARARRNKEIGKTDGKLTRQNVGAITGLSIGRVQGIIKEEREKES